VRAILVKENEMQATEIRIIFRFPGNVGIIGDPLPVATKNKLKLVGSNGLRAVSYPYNRRPVLGALRNRDPETCVEAKLTEDLISLYRQLESKETVKHD
jgi:hypothetical protein